MLGHENKIDYKDYLEGYGLLSEEEKLALIEHKKDEALRVKMESERNTKKIMSWVYSENYVEEV